MLVAVHHVTISGIYQVSVYIWSMRSQSSVNSLANPIIVGFFFHVVSSHDPPTFFTQHIVIQKYLRVTDTLMNLESYRQWVGATART